MIITEPSVEIYLDKPGEDMLKSIERYGRTCYQSYSGIGEKTYRIFIVAAIKKGHFSIIEHEKVTAKVICDRGVSLELCRHRIGSFSMESTRYISYKNGIEVIEPCFWAKDKRRTVWEKAMLDAEESYKQLLESGAKPEEARSVLPNSLKTEVIVTFNLREWRHFFWLRCNKASHPQMRQIAVMLLKKMQDSIPVIFDDFEIDNGKNTAETKILPAS
jgi:thymidylate synthase (FAD)